MNHEAAEVAHDDLPTAAAACHGTFGSSNPARI